MNSTTSASEYRVFSVNDNGYGVECPKCGTVLRVSKTGLVSTATGFQSTAPVRCQCGFESSAIARPLAETSAAQQKAANSGSQLGGGLLAIVFLFGVFFAVRGCLFQVKESPEDVAAKQEQAERSAGNQAAAEHRVISGMSEDQVRRAWGEPVSVHRTTSGKDRIETWSYSRNREVLLLNGRVSSVDEQIR